MHPVLFELGSVPVTAYGFALSLSFVVGISLARWRARKRGLDGEIIVEVSIILFVTSMVGSRLLFALENPELFSPPHGSAWDVLRPLLKRGGRAGELAGLSMSLGVALAALSSALFLWWRVPLRPRWTGALRYLDVMAPSVLLGEAITRVGCFMNGCCHGVACDLPWGVVFPPGSPAERALGSTPLHPTQLYASLAALISFLLLLALARSRTMRGRDGLVFSAFLVALPLARIVIDFFRYDTAGAGASSEMLHRPLVVGMLLVGMLGAAALIRRRTPAA